MRTLIEKLDAFLSSGGEPLLVAGNGVAVIVYFAAKYFGFIPELTWEQSLEQVIIAEGILNSALLYIRRLVSPV